MIWAVIAKVTVDTIGFLLTAIESMFGFVAGFTGFDIAGYVSVATNEWLVPTVFLLGYVLNIPALAGLTTVAFGLVTLWAIKLVWALIQVIKAWTPTR